MSGLSACQDDPILPLLNSDTERVRYRVVLLELLERTSLFRGQRVLDFGASWGTSAVALIRAGASEVVGIEPDLERVAQGCELVQKLGLTGRVDLRHCADTSQLPFSDGSFPFVLSNGVIEHIRQSERPAILREVWRVLAPGWHLMVSETPNYGLVKHLNGARLISEPPTRIRHRLLATVGLPPMLIDPWPLWVFRKPEAELN
jgi:ubiquinone/menaquinone biosynthesis C-methylase UbiE